MRFPKKLSLVIPVYNEEKRLDKALKICKDYLNKFPDWEFIFVNDGSTDKTEEMIKNAGFRVISYKKNQGKGCALKQGVKLATKPLTLITDIDFSTPLTELPKLYGEIESGFKMVIGSRKTKGSVVTKHQPKLREWLGTRFTDLSNVWLGLKVSDFTCGFKLFKTDTAKEIFDKQRIKRWGYDAEIVFIANKLGVNIKEVPVVWGNDNRTRVNLGKDILRSLIDLVMIRFNDLAGRYRH
ncbi:MAG: glycosyltransferase [Candidatus Beckwithbacteria bacterium]